MRVKILTSLILYTVFSYPLVVGKGLPGEIDVGRVSPSSYTNQIDIGTNLSFTAYGSAAQGLDLFEWYIDGQLVKSKKFTTEDYYEQNSWSNQFNAFGTYQVEFYVYDLDGDVESVSWQVQVVNSSPNLNRGNPSSFNVEIEPGDQVNFSVSASDEDGNLKAFEWYLNGDSKRYTSANGSSDSDTWSNTFNTPGTYVVNAYVYDDFDEEDIITWQVEVINNSPNLIRGNPDTFNVEIEFGAQVNFSVNASDEDGNLKAFEWYLNGDSKRYTSANGSSDSDTWSNTFNTPGTYVVNAYVYDDFDEEDIITWQVEVINNSPNLIRGNPDTFNVEIEFGVQVNFSVNASDEDGNLKAFEWYLDGDSKRYISANGSSDSDSWSNTFNTPGTYEVNAYVYDQFDEEDIITWQIDVVNNEGTQESIEFSGLTWNVRDYSGNPGPNEWSSSPQSIWVDDEKNLHMKIRNIGSEWYSTEVISNLSYGYGTYRFKVASNLEQYNENIVVGLFTYGEQPDGALSEIDLEFSKWGNPNTTEIGNYVVQPGNVDTYDLNLTGSYSTHEFTWSEGEVIFRSWHGHENNPSENTLINEWVYSGEDVPEEGNEKVLINFWLNAGNPPTNGEEAELIINSFDFENNSDQDLFANLFGDTVSSTNYTIDGQEYTFYTFSKNGNNFETISLPFYGNNPKVKLDNFVDDPDLAEYLYMKAKLSYWIDQDLLDDLKDIRRNFSLDKWYVTDDLSIPMVYSKKKVDRLTIGNTSFTLAGEVLKAKATGGVNLVSSLWKVLQDLHESGNLDAINEEEVEALIAAQAVYGGDLTVFSEMNFLQSSYDDISKFVSLVNTGFSLYGEAETATKIGSAIYSASTGDITQFSQDIADLTDGLLDDLTVQSMESLSGLLGEVTGLSDLKKEALIYGWLSDAYHDAIFTISNDLIQLHEKINSTTQPEEYVQLFEEFNYKYNALLYWQFASLRGMQLRRLNYIAQSQNFIVRNWVGATQGNIDFLKTAYDNDRSLHETNSGQFFINVRDQYTFKLSFEGAKNGIQEQFTNKLLFINNKEGYSAIQGTTTDLSIDLLNGYTTSISNLQATITDPDGEISSQILSSSSNIDQGGEGHVEVRLTVPISWLHNNYLEVTDQTSANLKLQLSWEANNQNFERVYNINPAIKSESEFLEAVSDKQIVISGEAIQMEVKFNNPENLNGHAYGGQILEPDGSRAAIEVLIPQSDGKVFHNFTIPTDTPIGAYGLNAAISKSGHTLIPFTFFNRIFYVVPELTQNAADKFNWWSPYLIYPEADYEAASDISSILGLSSDKVLSLNDYSQSHIQNIVDNNDVILLGGQTANFLVANLTTTDLNQEGDAIIKFFENAHNSNHALVIAGWSLRDTQIAGMGFLHQHEKMNLGQNLNIQYVSQWNLTGLPIDEPSIQYTNIFINATQEPFYYFNNSYLLGANIEPESGYWIHLSKSETVEFSGTPLESITLDLNKDWNLVSGIGSSLPVSSISDPQNLLASDWFGFDGSYYSASTLEPGYGYWIKARQAGNITLQKQTSKQSSNPPIAASQPGEEFNSLHFISEAGDTLQTLYFGNDLPNGIEQSRFAMPPVPPKGSMDARFSGVETRLTEDTEPVIDLQLSDQEIVYVALETPGFSYSTTYNLTQMVDGISYTEDEISANNSIEIVSSDINKLQLQIVQSVVEEKSEHPQRYSLEQNYPNPFNPTTQITYTLPSSSEVLLAIYDMTGRQVTTLVNQQVSAGSHTVTFDASTLSSGVYMYRLQAGQFQQVRRLTIIK